MIWVFLFAWNFLGAIGLAMVKSGNTGGVLELTEGWGFVNPKCVKEYNNVNWFGAVVVATIYAAICPVGAILYWLYMACTVGA